MRNTFVFPNAPNSHIPFINFSTIVMFNNLFNVTRPDNDSTLIDRF